MEAHVPHGWIITTLTIISIKTGAAAQGLVKGV